MIEESKVKEIQSCSLNREQLNRLAAIVDAVAKEEMQQAVEKETRNYAADFNLPVKDLTEAQKEEITNDAFRDTQPYLEVESKDRVVTCHSAEALRGATFPKDPNKVTLSTSDYGDKSIELELTMYDQNECRLTVSGAQTDWVTATTAKIEDILMEHDNHNWVVWHPLIRALIAYGLAVLLTVRVATWGTRLFPQPEAALWLLVASFATFGFGIVGIAALERWLFPYVELEFNRESSRGTARGVAYFFLGSLIVTYLIELIKL